MRACERITASASTLMANKKQQNIYSLIIKQNPCVTRLQLLLLLLLLLLQLILLITYNDGDDYDYVDDEVNRAADQPTSRLTDRIKSLAALGECKWRSSCCSGCFAGSEFALRCWLGRLAGWWVSVTPSRKQ